MSPLVGSKSKDLGVWSVFLYCVADSKRGKDLKIHRAESDEVLVRGGSLARPENLTDKGRLTKEKHAHSFNLSFLRQGSPFRETKTQRSG